jgi:predicted lactoylglutathione lyase
MSQLIFVNLPVGDLQHSTAFYEAIGAKKNSQFSDSTASCMVLSETIHVMLLTHDKFSQFTPRRIANAKETTEVLICISSESKDAVDTITENALAAGGAEPRERQDYGFMYSRAFEDPDGHIWEPMWMDMKAATAAMANARETTDA